MNNKMSNKMKALLVGTAVTALLGAGVAAASAGVGTVANTPSVIDVPASAVTNDDAPGHVSGKKRVGIDDSGADHADGHISGKNRVGSHD